MYRCSLLQISLSIRRISARAFTSPSGRRRRMTWVSKVVGYHFYCEQSRWLSNKERHLKKQERPKELKHWARKQIRYPISSNNLAGLRNVGRQHNMMLLRPPFDALLCDLTLADLALIQYSDAYLSFLSILAQIVLSWQNNQPNSFVSWLNFKTIKMLSSLSSGMLSESFWLNPQKWQESKYNTMMLKFIRLRGCPLTIWKFCCVSSSKEKYQLPVGLRPESARTPAPPLREGLGVAQKKKRFRDPAGWP